MSISSPGIGSGIDVNSIVDQLVTIERQPIVRLQQQESRIDAKLSAFGRLKGALSTLQDAARALTDVKTWQAAVASSADSAAVSASASGAAAPGSYAVQVDQLAKRQVAASAPVDAASTIFAAGTLAIERGTTGSFGVSPGAGAITVSVSSGDTLSTVRDRINAAGAGVTASLVNDSTGTRLVLRSSDTGASNAFRVTATTSGPPAPGQTSLDMLGADPSGAGATGMSVKQPAQDALFTVDGLELSSASNRVTDAVDGITLELRREGPDPVEVQVASDTDTLKAAVKKLVDAYGAVNALVAENTRYDPDTKSAGTLQGDFNVNAIQSRLRAVLQQSVAGVASGGFSRLSDVGITLQRNGSLAIDESRLVAALAKPEQVGKLFTAADPDPSKTGMAHRFNKVVFDMLATEGTINVATESLGRVKRDLDVRQEQLERRVVNSRDRLLRQYTELDKQLGQVTSIDWSKLYVSYNDR